MRLVLAHATQAGAGPYRLLEEENHEIAWANDFLHAQHLRQLSPRSPRAMPMTCFTSRADQLARTVRSLKGRQRSQPMSSAGIRSLFRAAAFPLPNHIG